MTVYHCGSFVFQTTLSILYMMLEYLEVLNLYNCERWSCGIVPCAVLLLVTINALMFKQNFDLALPLLISHTLGGAGLLFWSIEWWNVSTRHRTEYYDTHAMYCSMMFFCNVFTIYRYLDKESERANLEDAVRSVVFQRLEEGDMLANLPPVTMVGKKLSADSTDSEDVTVVVKANEPYTDHNTAHRSASSMEEAPTAPVEDASPEQSPEAAAEVPAAEQPAAEQPAASPENDEEEPSTPGLSQ